MSGHVTPALIAAIAESIGISSLSDEAACVLAPDVEYRVRDILQVRVLHKCVRPAHTKMARYLAHLRLNLARLPDCVAQAGEQPQSCQVQQGGHVRACSCPSKLHIIKRS
jgi:hypothetical protein